MTEPLPVIPFSEAIRIKRLDTHTYSANLSDDFYIGTVPNGGYTCSCMLEAVRIHLASRNQPHSVTSHFEFLSKAEAGPAVIAIEEVKLGRQLSTLHVSLYQQALLSHAPWISAGSSRKELVAYVTNTNLALEQGINLPTAFALQAPPPPADLIALAKNGQDDHWHRQRYVVPGAHLRSLDNCELYSPRRGQPDRSFRDIWVRLACGERFTNSSLAFLSDAFPQIVEAYRTKPGETPDATTFPRDQVFWYPTVVLNLELKRGVPDTGVEWLQLRITTKEIRNGRLDLDIIILNEAGELVALSQHVNLVLDMTRNLAKRKPKSNI